MPINPSLERKLSSMKDEMQAIRDKHKTNQSAQSDQVASQLDMIKNKREQMLAAAKKSDEIKSRQNEELDVTMLIDNMLAEADAKKPPVGQGGRDYEEHINNILKKHGKADKDATTAGSSADAPDAQFNHAGKKHNLEIKADSKAMFGQIELKHDGEQWDVSESSKKKYPATYKAIKKTGFLEKVNKQWKKPTGDYNEDLKMGNVYHDHKDASPIKAHYGTDRQTDYIQIGKGHGFYHTGNDTANLGSPELEGKTQFRARMKNRGTDKKTGKTKYGALVVMSLKDAPKSHHDLEKEVHKEWINYLLNGPTLIEAVVTQAVEPGDNENHHIIHMTVEKDGKREVRKATITTQHGEAHAIKNAYKHYEDNGYKVHGHKVVKELEQVKESRNQADKYWDEAEEHKAEAKKHKVGTEAHHHHMANHYDAMHRYHSDIGQHREASKAADKAEDHHEKAYEALHSMKEAHKIGDKVEVVKGSGKGITGHIGEIRHGAYKGAPKSFTVFHGEKDAIQVGKEHIKAVKEELEIVEGLGRGREDDEYHTPDPTTRTHKIAFDVSKEGGEKHNRTVTISNSSKSHEEAKKVARAHLEKQGYKIHEATEVDEGLKPDHNLRPGWMLKADPKLKAAIDAKKAKRKEFKQLVGKKTNESLDEATDHTVEAHGIKGTKGTPWRKTFKSHEHLQDWAEKNDSIEIHGTRELEVAKKKTNESLDEARMTAAMKLQKAFQSEQEKTARERKAGEELLKKNETPKKTNEETELDEARAANTASTRAGLAARGRKEPSETEKAEKKKSSDDAWQRLMAHAASQKKTNEEVVVEDGEGGGVAANSVANGGVAGLKGDAGKKAVMTKTPLKRKLVSFKEACDCWKNYKRKPGTKPCAPGSCVKEDNELDEAAVDAKGHKSSAGGLTQKGVDAYRRENPGSKLQTAVTTKPSKLDPDSKDAKRRKSFCARMSGVDGPMKDENGKPTRKALALRKWNC